MLHTYTHTHAEKTTIAGLTAYLRLEYRVSP